jgi:Actin-like ATPase involved in cell morphogenesis
MFINNVFGIDLGTGNIKISSLSKKKFINEKNMVAVKDKDEVIAIGDMAYEMYEKAPINIVVNCPMVNGVVGHINNTELLLYGLLKKISPLRTKHSHFYIVVPTDITEVQKRAFFAVVKGAVLRAKKVRIVEKAIADAAYFGIDFAADKGKMIVNIGAETTELAILAAGRVIISKTLYTGGNMLDEAICTLVRRRYNLNIGMKTAAILKKELSYVCIGEPKKLTVSGVNNVSGLPRAVEISSAVVNEAILEGLDLIIDSINSLIERTPPELIKDIVETGIYLTGGVANIKNLPQYIKLELGIDINLAQNPSESTIKGLTTIINNKVLRKLAYSIQDMPSKI